MNLTTPLKTTASLPLALALAAGLLAAPAHAWPDAPVRIVVPFTAGGASDVLTRALAEKLQARLGQNFIIDNRTGAGGNIGMEAVKTAPADGYTSPRQPSARCRSTSSSSPR